MILKMYHYENKKIRKIKAKKQIFRWGPTTESGKQNFDDEYPA